MTRIISGTARGRRLAVPAGRDVRPTSDRAREGLFSTLESMRRTLAGARFLDLYAGSGAVGLEAVSRGAGHALLVESSATAARVITANIAVLGLDRGELQVAPVQQMVRRTPAQPYDIVFADPPYAADDEQVRAVLAAAREQGWLAPDAIVCVERPTRAQAWDWPDGITADRSRTYGEATLWYGRAAGSSVPSALPADGAQPPPAYRA